MPRLVRERERENGGERGCKEVGEKRGRWGEKERRGEERKGSGGRRREGRGGTEREAIVWHLVT